MKGIDFERDLGKLKTLRRIQSGGDFNTNHILKWMNFFPSVKIYNVWGPTETSIVNTMYLIKKNRGYLNAGIPPIIVDENIIPKSKKLKFYYRCKRILC